MLVWYRRTSSSNASTSPFWAARTRIESSTWPFTICAWKGSQSRRCACCGTGRRLARRAGRAPDARLHLAEVQLALHDLADEVEDHGADEAKDRAAEVESDPRGNEQEAQQAEVVLEGDHRSSLLSRRS